MMGETRDGHSFLLVDPDGVIQWRADYGGAADYTMYVPVDNLLADLRAGLGGPAMTPRPTTTTTPPTTRITLLVQADCALCEHAKQVLHRVGADHPLQVTEIDATTSEGQNLTVPLTAQGGVPRRCSSRRQVPCS